MAPASLSVSREDVEAVQRLRQLYPPHILASLFDETNSSLLTPTRESVSSYSSGSVRSSVSSSPRNQNRNTGVSFTSSIPAISERAVSPQPPPAHFIKVHQVASLTSNPRVLTRSVSDYAIRDNALDFRSYPQQLTCSHPIYFCVHCGSGFEKRADWETHEWAFHERQSVWPCPQPGCQAFFDSAKSFEAHHQAVHGCARCDHAAKVVQLLPERQAWACGFKGCKDVFLDWSKRCKHVASHYELLSRKQSSFRSSPEWSYSTTIRNLLRQPELKDPFKKFMAKCHGHSRSSWPKLDWQPDKCAELQRCLEYRDFARGVADIVHLAYRLGHPGYSSSVQMATRDPTPEKVMLQPTVSPRSSSLRGRSRSQSIRSAMSHKTVAPPLHRSVSGTSISNVDKLSKFGRHSDASSFASGMSLPASPPPISPPFTRSSSPSRASSIFSNLEMHRPSTATRKRMIAREGEVKGTSSRALIDFLDEGERPRPSTSARKRMVAREGEARETSSRALIDFFNEGNPPRPSTATVRRMVARESETREGSNRALLDFLDEGPAGSVKPVGHSVRRTPRAVPILPDKYSLEYLGMTGHQDTKPEPVSVLSPKLHRGTSDYDAPVSPIQEHEEVEESAPVLQQDSVLRKPNEVPRDIMDLQQSAPALPREISQEANLLERKLSIQEDSDNQIKETILEYKTPSSTIRYIGHKVLPPTPGPPPTQLLPLPPPPTLTPPVIVYPDTPTIPGLEVPPSPMPPGFTDISNWPIPPPSQVPRIPSPPQIIEPPVPSRSPPVPPQESASRMNSPEQSRTANLNPQPQVLKLMPAPKRARSASRGRPLPLRWASLSSPIPNPADSSGVDFGNRLTQPLDLGQAEQTPLTRSMSVDAM